VTTHRPRKRFIPRPCLTVAAILAWADDYYKRASRWPKTTDGPVPADSNEK
jgi:hypothetical protein